MSASKHINAICWVVTALALVLTVLCVGLHGAAAEEDPTGLFDSEDLNDAWTTAGAARIDLSRESGDVYIRTAGRYVLSGVLEDGSVVVDADGKDYIYILLNGAELNCSYGAALRVEQAGKVILTLAEGTDNAIRCGAEFSAELADSGVDGALYSRDDLSINGSGALAVEAMYQHGIVCNDSLAITGGTITVAAVQDAIHANDAVRIVNAALTLAAGDDGITCKRDEGDSELYVGSGSIRVTRCYEGLESDTVTIAGGDIALYPTDDGINAMSLIDISGGSVYIENTSGRDADGLDSNGSISISGGKVFVSVNASCYALDCGTENGGKCTVTGGTVIACGGSSMAEGFDSTSTQGFLMTNVSGAAGSSLKLKKSDGTALLSETVPCAFANVVLSAPGMRVGDTCVLTVGETAVELTVDNSSGNSSGMFGGGMAGGKGGQKFNFSGDTATLPDGQMPDMNSGMGGMKPGLDGEAPTLPDGQTPDAGDRATMGGRPGMWGGETGDDAVSGATPVQPDQSDLPAQDAQSPAQPAEGGDADTGTFQRPQRGDTEFSQFKGNLDGQGTSAAPAEEKNMGQVVVLTGVSVLVLAAGLIFALKKKY